MHESITAEHERVFERGLSQRCEGGDTFLALSCWILRVRRKSILPVWDSGEDLVSFLIFEWGGAVQVRWAGWKDGRHRLTCSLRLLCCRAF